MNWIVLALLTIIFYSLMDFFIKLSANNIHVGLGGFIINFVSTVVLLVFLIYSKLHGEKIFKASSTGILYSTIAGISIGLATIFFLKMFSTGVNLSVGVPLVRVGIVLLASILGFIILKEGVNIKYIIGFLFSLIGLYLIVASR